MVDTGKITTLKFPTFWFDPTPQGKFMLSIAFGQSKYYVDNLSENIKRGIRQKLRNGIWPAWAPLGYVNDKNARCIVVDKEKAKYIKRAFEMYATGEYPLAQIRKIINSLGLVGKKGKMLSVSNYQYMLKNKIYYGMIEYNGELYDGKHEPIIPKKLFDSAQEVMMKKSKPKGKGLKEYIYRGFFRCGECGCFITTETQKGHNYLRCTKRKNPCKQKYVREEIITSQIRTELQKVSLPLDWANWMIAENDKDRQSEKQSSEIFSQKTKDEISLLDSKIEKLMNAYLENALSLEEYRESKNKLMCQKQLLKEKLSAFEKKSHNRFELADRFIKSSINNMELANEGIPEKLFREFKKVGSNFQILDRTVLFEPRGAWRILAELGFFGGNSEQTALRADHIFGSEALFEKLRRGRDSNSRPGYPSDSFQDCFFRPLRHPSL